MRRLALAFLCLAAALHATPTPPPQPATGPGGTDYPCAAVTTEHHGDGDDEYWLYLPDSPRPANAPVIVFTHGFGAMQPAPYEAWLRHLARRGNIVIYPRYQARLLSSAKDYTDHAVAAVRDALARLAAPDSPIHPETAHLACVGHSAGGVLAADLAVALPAAGLPRPLAVLSCEPGGSHRGDRELIPLLDLSRIDPGTLLITLTGDHDLLVGDDDARRIFAGASRVPLANKDYITLVSDDHGSPALVASHMAPTAPLEPETGAGTRRQGFVRRRLLGRDDDVPATAADSIPDDGTRQADALDFFGTWKLFDALCDAAFRGEHRDIALGGGPAQTDMGRWSDGTPVKPLLSTKTPPAPPR